MSEFPSVRLLLLGLVCVVSYAPSLSIPLMEDDYPNIAQARDYHSLTTVLQQPVFRPRATSYWVMMALWRIFRLQPAAYHVASLALHVVNTWLLYAIARMWRPMRAAALWAALFFAAYEGHQEAIMWFSAINEPLMFLFGCGAVLCRLLAAKRPRPWLWECAAIVLFALALVSKESAAVFLPLFLLTRPPASRRDILLLAPHCLLAALAITAFFATRSYSFRFAPGGVTLQAPFWIMWPRSFLRVMWIWGWISVALAARRAALFALAWIGIALLPYSFLTFSAQIPSRQTYLAAAGLALLFGLAVDRLSTQPAVGRKLAAAALALMLLHNVGLLWIRKRRQFLERAEPTEQLLRFARQTPGPIWVRCFPQPPLVAEEAVHLVLGRAPSSLLWREANAPAFCYAPARPGR